MNTNFVTLDKTGKKALTFVKAATSKDRETLKNINFNGGMVSCDGCRLHYIHANPTNLEGLYEIEKVSDVIQPKDNSHLNYPDIEHIVSLSRAGDTEIKDTYFSINAKYLLDAIKQCGDGMITFRVTDNTHPIELTGMVDDIPAYAMIMPMLCEDQSIKIANARP